MTQEMIYVAALPDEQTAQYIHSLRAWLCSQGFALQPEALPPHLLLAGYPAAAAPDVLRLTAAAAAKTRGFAFAYDHVGVSPDGTRLMLAPEVNRPLLTLRERFVHSQGWPLHTPLITIAPQLLPQVLTYVLPNMKPFDARVTALAVLRQDGAVLLRQEV